jgi:hypothetical protein
MTVMSSDIRRKLRYKRYIIGGILTAVIISLIAISIVVGIRDVRVYRLIELAGYAQTAVGTANSDEETALQLFDYLLTAMPFSEYGIDGDPEFPDVIVDNPYGDSVAFIDNAIGSLIRGGAVCDSMAWTLVRLAEQRGIDGRIAWLTDENGVSPHTVAELWIDDEWRVFDPYYGVIPRNPDGTVATSDQIARGNLGTGSVAYRTSEDRRIQGFPDELIGINLFSSTHVFYESANPGLLTNIRTRVLTEMTAVTWPVIQDLHRLLDREHRYLPRDEMPGDAAYLTARRYHLAHRYERARDFYQQAIDEGTQWSVRSSQFIEHIDKILIGA